LGDQEIRQVRASDVSVFAKLSVRREETDGLSLEANHPVGPS
jgi:hypothetical protein